MVCVYRYCFQTKVLGSSAEAGLDLRQPIRAAARVGCRRRQHHSLAPPVRRQRLASRPAPGGPLYPRGHRRRFLGRQLALGRARLELVELKFQLVEKTLLTPRVLTVELAPELIHRWLEECDLRRGKGPTYSPRRSPPAPRPRAPWPPPPQAPSSMPRCRTGIPPARSNHSTRFAGTVILAVESRCRRSARVRRSPGIDQVPAG